ncbi:hypothetical protein SDC9_188000 [bioreactor metagenome]|uniref:Uncharacterized protein n=1 Tax=bioreactor metagenome TaxID=1076179 RepID=A0A645HYU1_9ZZZZ
MLEEQIKELKLQNFKIHEDPLNSNVIGAKAASELMWGVNSENE